MLKKSIFLSQCLRILFTICVFGVASSSKAQCTVTDIGGNPPGTYYVGPGIEPAPATVILQYGPECFVPAATASASWIDALNPSSPYGPSSGDNDLNYEVEANPYNAIRTATVAWWGYVYTIVQDANNAGPVPGQGLGAAGPTNPQATLAE